MGMDVRRGPAHSSDGPSTTSDESADFKSCSSCGPQIASSSGSSSVSLPADKGSRRHHPAWGVTPARPDTQQEEWDNFIRNHQTGEDDGQKGQNNGQQCSSSSLADFMVLDSNGHLISSRDFFLKSGYIASPPALAQHRRRRDAALLRHRLDQSFGDPLLDAHCQQAKLLFQSDFSAISLAQIDTNIIQVMGAVGSGLEDLVNHPLPRSSSLCSHALLLGERSALLCDRSKDWRFKQFPFGPHPNFSRQSELGFNFYASAPLMLSAPGDAGQDDIRVQVGRFCVMSIDGRDNFGEEELSQLETIAKMASDLLERKWESRRALKLLKMQSSSSQLTSDFHQRLLTSSSQSMGADAEQKLEADIQALLQKSCEQVAEHLEAAGSLCIGLSSRSDEEDKFDAQQEKKEDSYQPGFETTVVSNEEVPTNRVLDTRNNVVNRVAGAIVPLHVSTKGLSPLDQIKRGDKVSSKMRLLARAGETAHLPSSFTPAQDAAIESWMLQHAGKIEMSNAKPMQYRSATLRKEYADRYPDDRTRKEDQDADRLRCLLPDNVGTFVVMPIMTLESDSSYAIIVYWSDEYLFEDWDSNFLKSAASIVQSACIRRHALLSERAELRVMRSVRHEMRTPLHGIIGMSTQLQQCLAAGKGTQDEEGVDISESLWLSKSIQHAGEDLRKLLDNLLECGEGNSPSSPNNSREDANVVHLIEGSCEEELLAGADRALVDHLSHQDENQPPAPSPFVLIHAEKDVEQAMFESHNAERVYKMIGQFISNAIRFSKPSLASGDKRSIVEISVRLLQSHKGNGKAVEVSIQDYGIGMSQSFLRHFAQPFQKASTFKQGAGLGAVLGRSILNQLQGSMKVASTEGNGTCVTLTFPPDKIAEASHDTNDLSLEAFRGILCNFDPVKDASLLKMLHGHFESRKLSLVDEEVEQSDGCKFFFYDSNSQSSRKKLASLCQEASPSQKLVIFSSSLKLELDSNLKSLDSCPFILCCLNPLGPTALEVLDCFLEESNCTEAMQKLLSRSHRRSSSTKTLSDYTEHTLSPSNSQPFFTSDRSSAPASPTTTVKGLKTLSMVPESGVAPNTIMASPIEEKPKSRRGSKNEMAEGPIDSSGFSVLIVEDNPINMRMLEACAKKAKCFYKTAFDGQEAVQKYKEMQPSGPSVVLLDISLPIMDGFDACKAMRASTASEDQVKDTNKDKTTSRIVAITALSSPQDVESGLAIGMDEWRVKPANLPKLTADLSRWQKEWQAAASLEESHNEISKS